MSITTAAVAFALIAVAELPDKTMIAMIVLAGRYRPLHVWLGAAAAFALQCTIAVAAGRLLELLPHRALEILVAVLFAAGAVYLLASKESREEHEGEEEAERSRGARRAIPTVFVVIAIGEMGDLTQILTANLAARYHDPLAVLLGATLGLWGVSALAVSAGQALVRVVPLAAVRKAAGVVLAALALYSALSAF
ncbi:MAG: TMEM165/GDT1 family protein [Acidimicrobiales bacterium]|nr:TMEM165/GDT1 family protein [Actinomycetota bacterium]